MLNRRYSASWALRLIAGTGARADDIYIPLISKGFQHQFWQAVKAGAEQSAKENNVKISFEGPETEAMVDKQIDMLSAASPRSRRRSASPRSTARRRFRC
jgi:ribose transport system substrate-binding protein